MKVVRSGLIGTRVKCPRCLCVVEIEKSSEIKEEVVRFVDKIFSVVCAECGKDIVFLKEIWVPKPFPGMPVPEGFTGEKIETLNRA